MTKNHIKIDISGKEVVTITIQKVYLKLQFQTRYTTLNTSFILNENEILFRNKFQLEKSPESLESSIFLGDIFFAKAKAYKNLEEFGKVEEQSAKAIKLYEKAKAFKKSNTTKNWLAKAIYQNQAEEAVKIYNQVILQSIERKDTSSLIDSKTDLLSLHYNLANFDRCTKIAYELIELKKNYSLPLIEEIKIFNILGNINSVNENTPKAIEYYQKAHIAATKINNHYVLTFINFNLAILYHNEEKLALTERYYLKSLEASNLSEKPYAKAFASLKFAHYLIEKDSALIDAKKHLKDCITHFSKEKRYSYESYGLGLLGVTELRLGNRDAGLLKFDEVEKLIPKNPNKRHLSILLGHMAEDCDKANFHKRAYKYQKLKEELDKEIFDEESQNELLQLQTDYEIKEKELEISTLKQKNTDQSLIGFLLFAFIAALLIFSFFLWRQRHTLRAKNQELDIAKEKAEHLAKSKAEFLATMSHEIRTPMNGVIGMANILEDENLCPNQKENLEILKFSADNLLHLINDILDISKIDSGKIILEQKEFDLESHFKKLFSIFTTANKNSDLNLNLDIQLGDLKNLVIGDTLRLNQVISNLINNALKFTKEGSISLHIKTVKQFSEKVKVKFEVIDTGIGISPENQKAIFKKFQQAENETSRLYGGTGLGLNIAKEIIALT